MFSLDLWCGRQFCHVKNNAKRVGFPIFVASEFNYYRVLFTNLFTKIRSMYNRYSQLGTKCDNFQLLNARALR